MKIYEVPSQKEWLKTMKKVWLGTGITMAYQEFGNIEKPIIIMMHGWCDSSRATRMICKDLEKDFHIYSVDLRGHGHSDKPVQFAYTPYQYMQDISAFTEKLNIKKFHVLGISMGSFAAQCVAYSMPDKVNKLILLATASRIHHTPAELHKMTMLLEKYKIARPSLDELIPTHSRFEDQEFPEEAYKAALSWPDHCWQAAWNGMEMTDNLKFLQYIEAPALCIWGTEDTVFPKEYQNEILENIPNVEAVYLEGGSHEIQQEKPHEIAAHIKQFLTFSDVLHPTFVR